MNTDKTEEFMKYDQFLKRTKTFVKKRMGGDYFVDINHVTKNNSIELDGLIILKNGEKITPNIYLNNYYENYMNGEGFEDIVEELIKIYEETMENGEREALCIEYELDTMKPYIVFRIVNYQKNSKLLKEIPHIHYLDLAITFHCLVKDTKEGLGTIRITNEHIEQWNITLEELTEIARINTPNLLPVSIRSMNEVIIDILNKDLRFQDIENMTDGKNQIEDILNHMNQEAPHDMYVLTNIKGINGASCLLYPEVIKELAYRIRTDFYILPSSIHEIILVKDNGQIDINVLHEMVLDVNYTHVAEDEVLSDHVYFYSRERNAITLL